MSSSTATPSSPRPPRLLRPGVALMRRLDMRLKLIGLTLVLMVPSVVIGSMLLHGIATDWRYTAGERALPAVERALTADPPAAHATTFERNGRAVQAVLDVMDRIGEVSGLLLDPQAETYFLMDLTVTRLPKLAESISVLRGDASGLLARDDGTSVDDARILGLTQAIDTHLRGVQQRMRSLQLHDEEPPSGVG
ncbi:MAG: hypothetical protein ACK4GB_05095 [Tepidimonas sp.]